MERVNLMKKKILLLFILLVVPLLSQPVSATIDLSSGYWETTFDCDTDGNPGNGDTDWLQYADPLNCDGIGKGGDWTSSGGHYTQIVSGANNPAGGGGKGEYHWIGDGVNQNSGGVRISFDSPRNELWVRWYQKYQLGFNWNRILYTKNIVL